MKKKKKRYFTELAEKYRGAGVTPQCKHFEKCGGCMFQDLSYENQLLLKKEYLNTLFEGVTEIEEVYPSSPFQYRNRMDMVTAFGKFGLREAGSYKFVVDIESCAIMQEKAGSLFTKLGPLVKEIEGYNYLNHEGYLRYVIFRQAFFSKELMVNFVIADRENRLGPVIAAIEDEVDSISLLFNDGLADTSFGEVSETIKKGYIEESFDDTKYKITPNSFFQSNSDIARIMYREIRKETEGRTLDLYSGVGSISLFVADKAESVTGVEFVAEAVETANENKKINGVANVDFVCEDSRIFLRDMEEYIPGYYDTLILDPPRSGINPRMLKYLNMMAPKKIVYMSCNPAAFRSDLDGLEGYTLERFEAYDMFPQTPHVEALAVLVKR
ncbi:MAG: 23S rRNA (uracil(1939)-C(5))-methyltransferase RlmD [bacterium]|nr:23S rRNA (uracil(1939)-C(5))-methyltransferase RlmD [bacterium]